MSNQNQESGINSFLEAVNYLFHSNDSELKKKANKFLIEFESKPESWDISYQILLKDNLPDEVYYNALNILKNKIKYDFASYIENPGYIENLLSFFLNNIDRFKKAKHYILINYCNCIGKAFLFTGDKFHPLLKNFTAKLCGQNADIESLISLLLIFYFLCETKFDKRIVIEEKYRRIFSDNVIDISDDVFKYIIFMINKLNTIEDKNLKNFISKQILETLNDYIYLDFDENILLKFNNEYLSIIDFIFNIDETNLDKHSESICGLLNLPLNEDNMRNLAKIIFSKILKFKDIFYKSIESLDEEQTSFYIDVFSLMIENNFEDIFKEKRFDLFQIIIDLIKKCPEKKIYTLVDFFIHLNQFLYDKNYNEKIIMDNFKNIFTQAILNFITLTKFDDDIFSKLNVCKTKELQNNDDYNITLTFRTAIKELMKDFVQNYGINFMFNDILFPEFEKVILKIKENSKIINNWCKLENLLYIFSFLFKYTNIEDPSFQKVLIIFQYIFDVPQEFTQIIRTVTEIMDNCSGIISDSKDLVIKGFQYLIKGLDNNLITKYCSVSAKILLSSNREQMSELRKDLILLYENKIKNNILSNEKLLYLLEGLTIAISYSDKKKENENYDIIKAYLVKLIEQWIFYLQQAKDALGKNNNFSPEEINNLNKILTILKSISESAFISLCSSHKKIMYEILIKLYPSLIYILQKLSIDSKTVEKIIQLFKVYMRGLVDNFIKFIPEYVNCIINGYKLSPISSYLYAFEILITVFPNRREEELLNILNLAFKELCNITLTNYLKNIFDIDNNVQLGEDFYGMLYRIMKDSPLIILESDILEQILNASLMYITTSQLHVSKNITIFIKYFIKFQQSQFIEELIKNDKNLAEKCINIIQQQMNKFSPILCQKILEIYVNTSVEQIIEEITSLLEEFVFCNRSLASKGMTHYLKDLPNDILTNKEKEMFIELIENYNNKEKEFNKFIDNFISRCINKQNRNRGQQ